MRRADPMMQASPTSLRASGNGAVSSGDWLGALEDRAERSADSAGIAELNADGKVAARASARQLMGRARTRSAAMVRALPRGASLVVALPSGIDLAVWMVAAVRAGVRLIALHPSSTAIEVQRAATAAGAAAVIRGGGACDAALNPRPELGRALLEDRSATGGDSTCGRGGIALSSSGSTGMPKLALRDAAALDADALAVTAGLHLTDRDAVLCIPPLCHSYGLDLLLGALWSGAELRLMPEFGSAGAARAIAEGITVLPATPFVFESLARVEPAGGARLRLAVSAGSTLSPRVRVEFERAWGVPVGQLYGATELGTVAVHRPDEAGFDPASIGGPLAGVSFRLMGGETPELAVRAPSMLSAYLDAELRLEDGHFRTGDLARIDGRGRFHIIGRCKHLIDAGGFKVNPLEVEAALMEHPAVRECAAAPLWLSDTVCKVRALLVLREGADRPEPADLRAFLRDRLAPAKLPRVFEVVESLPRSPLGKLLRDRLGGAC